MGISHDWTLLVPDSDPLSFPDHCLQNIRVVALDAVGTVMEPVPKVGEVYHQVGLKYGTRKSLDEVVLGFKLAFAATESVPVSTDPGGLDPWWTSEDEEFRRWRSIVERVLDDLPDLESCFRELHEYFAKPSSWRIFPDVPPTIAGLKSRGLRVVLASNFDHRLHSVVQGSPGLEGIDECFVSAELGARKPSVGFYSRLLERLQVASHELLMIGDDLQNDFFPPTELGVATLWLNRTGHPSEVPSLDSLTSLLRRLPPL